MFRLLAALTALGIAFLTGAPIGRAQSPAQMAECDLAKEWWADNAKRDLSGLLLPQQDPLALKGLRYLNHASDASKVLAFCPPAAAPFRIEDVHASVKYAAGQILVCPSVGQAVQSVGNLPAVTKRARANLEAPTGLTSLSVIGYRHTLAEFQFWAAIQPDVGACVNTASVAAALDAAKPDLEAAGAIVQAGSVKCQTEANAYLKGAEDAASKGINNATAGFSARSALSGAKLRAERVCAPYGADPKAFIDNITTRLDFSLAVASPTCKAVVTSPVPSGVDQLMQQRNANGAAALLPAAQSLLASARTSCTDYPAVISNVERMVGDLTGLSRLAKR